MKLQRQHFLLSYLKTLSVGPVGVSNSQPPASQPGEQPSELPVGGSSLFSIMISLWSLSRIPYYEKVYEGAY